MTTDGAGNAAFSATLPVGTPAGSVITATAAQDATGNTSEFSACVTVVAVPTPAGDVDRDGIVNVVDLVGLIAEWGPCPGPCPPSCAADFDDDCQVDVTDLIILLANWG